MTALTYLRWSSWWLSWKEHCSVFFLVGKASATHEIHLRDSDLQFHQFHETLAWVNFQLKHTQASFEQFTHSMCILENHLYFTRNFTLKCFLWLGAKKLSFELGFGIQTGGKKKTFLTPLLTSKGPISGYYRHVAILWSGNVMYIEKYFIGYYLVWVILSTGSVHGTFSGCQLGNRNHDILWPPLN